MPRVEKDQFSNLYLTEEMIEVFSAMLQSELSEYKAHLDNRPFIRNIINIMFKNASTVEEKVYLYRFSVANQLKKDYNEINILELLEKNSPSIVMLINQLNIDVRNLGQFMFLPSVGVKMNMIIK